MELHDIASETSGIRENASVGCINAGFDKAPEAVITNPNGVPKENTICVTVPCPVGTKLQVLPTARTSKSIVIVREAVKRYGSADPVLNNFNMTVKQGTIYSLLGSSGCGKTTLLSCVVGLRHLNRGQIRVFGAEPGTKESGIPGKRVGYMPQDSALYNDLTITEAIRYFGAIYAMPISDITARQQFLIEFLDLPFASRRIGALSGGQKRRVSLALSLIHSPELLILDEPTVGVDPLLRESIWNHLFKLVSSQNTTVIITTHYIEEARQSNTIGLMRGGRLLTEKSPDVLLKEYNCNLLEDIVLKLCKNDTFGSDKPDYSTSYKASQGLDENSFESETNEGPSYPGFMKSSSEIEMSTYEHEDTMNFRNSWARIKALTNKNVLLMIRNWLFLLCMIFVPAFQVFVVCISIGGDPRSLKMGYVMQEKNYSENCLTHQISHDGCDITNLGSHFLSKLSSEEVVLKEYETDEEARVDVHKGQIWGYLSFREGFSTHIYSKLTSGNVVDNETLDGSKIFINMDMSNKQIFETLKHWFSDAYNDFSEELLTNCGFNPKLDDSPIKYLPPVYGTDDTLFSDYVAPGVLICFVFFIPLCTSGVSYIKDKKQGTLERSLVAGIQTWEIMVAFFISEGCVLVIQSGLALAVIVGVFDIVVQGSFLLVLSLSILMALTGVSLSFLAASFCNEEVEAAMLEITAFIPNMFLGSVFWPVEGVPVPLNYVSYLLPCTLPSEAIRSIINRGSGLTHATVWPGFASLLGWIFVYSILTVLIHRMASRRK